MTKLGRYSAVWILGALAAAPPLWSQNLIANGELDVDTLDWHASGIGADLDWDTLDHDECGNASGSALATNAAVDGGQVNVVACVTGIVAGAPYSLDGFLRIPTGETATGGVLLRVFWADDCDGKIVDISETSELPSTNQGVWIHKALRDLVAPVGAQNALVGAMVYKSAGAAALRARFDGIHLVPGHGFLFGENFESESTCRWSEVAE